MKHFLFLILFFIFYSSLYLFGFFCKIFNPPKIIWYFSPLIFPIGVPHWLFFEMLMKYKVSNQKLLCQFGFANTGKKRTVQYFLCRSKKSFCCFCTSKCHVISFLSITPYCFNRHKKCFSNYLFFGRKIPHLITRLLLQIVLLMD